MKSVFYIIVIVVWLAGIASCGAQKKVLQSQEADTSISMSREDSVRQFRTHETIEKAASIIESEIMRDIELEQVYESLTLPDSSGRQYVKDRTITTIRSMEKERSGQKDTASKVTKVQKDSTAVVSTAMYSAGYYVENTVTATGLRWWQSALIWLGVIFLSGIIVRILIRGIWKL